jgi:4-hydroxyacetophenone monooxygenase
MTGQTIGRKELLGATDAEIETAVAQADAILLRGLLYLINGDEEAAAIPQSTSAADFRGPLPTIVDPGHVARLRRKAVDFLKSYRDAGAPNLPVATDRLNRAMDLVLGVQIPEDERPMWIEQMGLDPMARSFEWDSAYPEPTEAQKQGFLVAVIGAGMGGLNSAMQLKRAGIPFVVIEKNGGVGGTWYENRYPGARVDTPSRNYFHTFATGYPCPGSYCPQAVNQSYFDWVADKFELRENIAFRTEVKSVVWDEDAHIYNITAEGPDGQKSWRANAVISCVGFLNRPNLPKIAGAESYTGQIIHTARWPNNPDLAGKRIAVIGSGATSYQMVPEVLKLVGDTGQLTLFQRTPSWCFEMPGYLEPFSPEVMWLDRNLPFMANFSRLQASWVISPTVLLRLIDIDPNYEHPHARSEINKLTRDAAIATMTRMMPGRPDLVEKMTPLAPPFSSRPILMDGGNNIYNALMQDNVELVTDAIETITPNGIATVEGKERPFDVIVYATGFKANEFLWPIDLRGRGGKSIGKLWERDGARAYLGTMIPGFPNFFMIYGPNMNPFLNGLGVVEMEELSTRFALRCIGTLIRQNRHSVDVEESAYNRFNEELDRLEANKIYADHRVTNYYKNGFGRSAVNCPFDVRLLWKWWRDPADAEGLSKISDPLIRPYIGQDLRVE